MISILKNGGIVTMSVLSGCEEKNKTPILEERVCPNCGDEVEVFTVKGRLIDDFACECGYIFHKEEQIVPKGKKHSESDK